LVQRLLHWRDPPSPVPTPEGRVIAFASGKGGTGKSFVVTNLAVALHQTGHRVCVVDCDYGLGNAHLLMGVNPRMTMHHLLGGAASVSNVMVHTPFGPDLVPGGSGISSLAELNAHHFELLAQALGVLARSHDVLLLDCAAGLSPPAMMTILAAEALVVVTNPEIAALTDAYALIKCIARQPRVPEIKVVVNRVSEPGQGQPTFDRLSEVAQRFVGRSLHYLGEIPENPAVSHRRLGQPPLLVSHPECNAAIAVRQTMEAMERTMGPLRANTRTNLEGVQQRIQRILRGN
jgi:flagellar biosynthesis protein FlhG